MTSMIKVSGSVSRVFKSPGHALAMSVGRVLKVDSTVVGRSAGLPVSFFFEEFLSELLDLLLVDLDALLLAVMVEIYLAK